MIKKASVILLLIMLAACANTKERVVLLPQADKPSAVVVTNRQGKQELLNAPYATADVEGSKIKLSVQDQQQVRQRYQDLLDSTPRKPESFELNFDLNSENLTRSSQDKLATIVDRAVSFPAVEIVIIGHSDRVGGVAYNDKLSLQRANLVKNVLLNSGVSPESIVVVGRGEREPLVNTADETEEPRNRRVEIKLR